MNPESSSHSSPVLRGATGSSVTRSPIKAQEQAAKEAKMKEDKLREEEEFQLALALSQSEAEFKSQKTYSNYNSSTYEAESRADERRPSLTGAQQGNRYPTAGTVVIRSFPSNEAIGVEPYAEISDRAFLEIHQNRYFPETVEANAPTRSECGSTTGSTESELTHYLDRKYWDERSNRVGDTDTPKHTTKPLDGMVRIIIS